MAKKQIKLGILAGVVFGIFLIWYVAIVGNVRIETENQIVNVGEEFVDDGKTSATFYGKDITKWLKVESNVDTSMVGEYQIKYSFLGKSTEKIVSVKDCIPPTIILKGEKEVYLKSLLEYQEKGYTAWDEYSGDLTDKVEVSSIKCIDDENYLITYSVVDDAGNSYETERKIIKEYVGTVCLTFDDGPSKTITSKILQVLEDYGVKATFFVVDFDKKGAEVIKNQVDASHTVGLHGYSHDYSVVYASLKNVMDNFAKLEEKVQEITGTTSTFIRFPGGSSNTVSRKYCKGVMSSATIQVQDAGFVYYDWNVDSNDAGSSCGKPSEIYQNVISGVLPGRTNVVLMHDSEGHEATLEALPLIIEYLQKEGYDFKAITSETPVVHHNVNN